MNRRTFLAAASTAVAATAAAGCSTDLAPDADSDGDSGPGTDDGGESCSVDPDRNPGTPKWPTATGDRRNTRSAPRGTGPEPPLSVEWTVVLDGYIGVPSPTVAGDTVFTSNMDTTVRAVDGAGGETTWTASVESPGVPVVADDSVVVGGDDGTLSAFDRSEGSELWAATLPHPDPEMYSQPTVAAGTVLAPTQVGLAAFDRSTGDRRWYYETGLAVGRHPAVADGTVYATGGDAYVHAVDVETGERTWWTKTPEPLAAAPAVDDGTVYAGTEAGTVLALDAATGEERWRSDVAGGVERLGVDGGHVYVGTRRSLIALDAGAGAVCWRNGGFRASYAGGFAATPDRVYATLAAGSGSTGDALAVLDPATGEETWRFASEDYRVTSGPAVADGAVYVGGGIPGSGLGTLKLA